MAENTAADCDESGRPSGPRSGVLVHANMSPAEEAATLLEQTRAFSRAVNQLRADMEQCGMLL